MLVELFRNEFNFSNWRTSKERLPKKRKKKKREQDKDKENRMFTETKNKKGSE